MSKVPDIPADMPPPRALGVGNGWHHGLSSSHFREDYSLLTGPSGVGFLTQTDPRAIACIQLWLSVNVGGIGARKVMPSRV